MSGEDKMDYENKKDMKENDDIWLKQWKDCLDDYEEEVPVNGWERLQADLQANDERSTFNGQVIPFRRWKVVAAAAVVVLVAGAGIWFLASDQAPQVPSVESPLAQLSQNDIPEPETPLDTIESEQEDDEEEPIATFVSNELSPADAEISEQPAKPVKKPTEASAPATQTTQISTTIASQAKVSEPQAEETKREGTPIQVRNVNRNQAQRSATPVAVASQSNTSEEVGVVNRRQIRVSTDERMQNVTRLRGGQSNATTRSYSEITDMDRVYNSFSAHYDELYNKTEHLFNNGTGSYSTLDNALFLAGLVKKMQNQRSAADEQLYREIAGRLVELQQPNGLWKDSLLDPSSRTVDTDTESYICYALAWGLNNGLLSRKQYRDAVNHAWKAIGNCNSEPCLMAAEQVQKLQ